MSKTPWLLRYADPMPGQWCSGVIAISVWSVATDRRSLLAWSDGGRLGMPHPGVPPRLGPTFLDGLARTILHTRLCDLLLWCGHLSFDVCLECKGECLEANQGVILVRYCDACEGVGWYFPGINDVRHGMLAGVRIDMNRLAWTLAPDLLDAGEDEVSVGTLLDGHALVIDGSRFRLVQMCVTPMPHHPAFVPTFHADPMYAQLWLEREDPAGAAVLADWLEDQGDGEQAAHWRKQHEAMMEVKERFLLAIP